MHTVKHQFEMPLEKDMSPQKNIFWSTLVDKSKAGVRSTVGTTPLEIQTKNLYFMVSGDTFMYVYNDASKSYLVN